MSFLQYINKFRTTEKEYTHIRLDGGKYNVPKEKQNEFMDNYIRGCINGEKISLNEYDIDDIKMIRVDLDFKQKTKERGFTLEMIYNFTDIFCDKFIKYVDIDKETLYNDAIISYRDEPYETDDFYKDGIHIVFPSYKTHYELQKMIREEMLSELPRIFNGMSIMNSYNDVYDEGIIFKPMWMLIGTYKYDRKDKKYLESYKVINTNIDFMELVKKCSLFNDRTELLINVKHKEQFLTRIKPKKEIEKKEHKKIELEEHKEIEKVDIQHIKNALSLYKNDNLSYDEWRNCLNVLKNQYIAHNERGEIFELALEWSKKSNKHIFNDFIHTWGSIDGKSHTFGTLCVLTGYRTDQSELDYFINHINEHSLTKLFLSMVKDKYISDPVSKESYMKTENKIV